MANVTVSIDQGAQVGSRLASASVEREVSVPKPKSVVLQAIAVIVLVGLTAVLAILLSKDPSTLAAALEGICLLFCIFVLVLWAAAVLGLGVGPAQLLALLRTVVAALKASRPEPAPTPPGR